MNIKTIDISKRLRHPYLMPILNTIDDNPIYPVPNGNIYLIKKDNLIKYVNQILLALYYAHGRTIILNNIMPENIFYFQESDSIRIGNFSNSTYNDTIFRTYTSNNINYIAPEAFIESKVNTKSDIWMLGLTIFQVLYNFNPQENIIKEYGVNNMYIQKLDETIKKLINEIKNDNLVLLLSNLLEIDHKKRLSADQLLKLQIFNEYKDQNKNLINLYQSCPIRVDFIDSHNLNHYYETMEKFQYIKDLFKTYNNDIYFWILFNGIEIFNKLITVRAVNTLMPMLDVISLACITISFKLYYNDFNNHGVYEKLLNYADLDDLQKTENSILNTLRHKVYIRNIYGFLTDINKQVDIDSLYHYVINTVYTGELGDYAYNFIHNKMPSIAFAISNA